MRTLKSLFATIILVSALSISAFADGNISTPGVVNPPPPPPATSSGGNISTTGVTNPDNFAELAFADILLVMFSIF